jgi:Transglutaminase-like superfamily
MVELADLSDLRIRAQDAIATKHYDALLALSPMLRGDAEYWATYFAPECAIAARATGRDDARAFLDEAISGGFTQHELFPQLETLFSVDPDWDRLVERMRANVPPPALEILDWPSPVPTLPLDLDALPSDRAELLRELLPEPQRSAWATATATLTGVTQRWAPGTDPIASRDALEVLEAVASGARFSCVEYTVVLSQALNALGIPARSVGLMTADYHFGVGRGHNVTEAWIDDLGRWVLLDGQNGMWWTDSDGTPLGLVELRRRYADGGARAMPATAGRIVSRAEADFWWRTFASGTVGGRSTATWRTGAYVPVFEGQDVATCTYLVRDPAAIYPDLSEVSIGISAIGGGTHLLLHTTHPYATGFSVMLDGYAPVTVTMDNPRWKLAGVTGEHSAIIAAITPYEVLRGSQVRYLVR